MADATRRVSVRLSLDDATRVKAGLGQLQRGAADLLRGSAGDDGDALQAADEADHLVGGGADLAGSDREALEGVDALGDGDAGLEGVAVERLVDLAGALDRAGGVLQAGEALGERVAGLDQGAGGDGHAGDLDAAGGDVQQFERARGALGAALDLVERALAGLADVAQALASGVLQGDELRSILEAMPLLAEGLARELGVSIGELRKLGSEGKLTAERVFPALLRATERLGAELDKAPLSLGRAFGQGEHLPRRAPGNRAAGVVGPRARHPAGQPTRQGPTSASALKDWPALSETSPQSRPGS